MVDAYQASLDFLYRRLNYERVGMPRIPSELRLGRMRRLLRRLGDPQAGLRIVHVAGTKGKGSTSAMLAAALSASGIRTGLFCSPHLHRLEERFRIDGAMATPEAFVALTEAVRPTVEALDAENVSACHREPTFFEVTTAMGLLHFAREGAGAVVLEVGMGGRLDSTNVVRPLVGVVTNISLDHTKQLGNTLGAIAGEKAGILKRGRPVVCGDRGREAREVVRRVAAARGGQLREIGTDFDFAYEAPEPPLDRPTAGRVHVKTWARDWGAIELPLLGAHQAHNAAVALATLDVLGEQGIAVGRGDVIKGFAGLSWPARVEVMGEGPWLVVDGSHNVASAEALAATLKACFPRVSRTLVFGTTKDKDLRGQLKALLPGTDRVVATRYLENPRAVPPEDVAEAVRELGWPGAMVTGSPAEGIQMAMRMTPARGLVCVTGSLFLAAEARAWWLSRAAAEAVGS